MSFALIGSVGSVIGYVAVIASRRSRAVERRQLHGARPPAHLSHVLRTLCKPMLRISAVSVLIPRLYSTTVFHSLLILSPQICEVSIRKKKDAPLIRCH